MDSMTNDVGRTQQDSLMKCKWCIQNAASLALVVSWLYTKKVVAISLD